MMGPASVLLVVLSQVLQGQAAQDRCRSKFGYLPEQMFRMHSCAWCYHYITLSRDVEIHAGFNYLVVRNNNTVFPRWTILIADADNATMADRVCKTTNPDMCQRWRRCCHDAADCCRRQLEAGPRENNTCPRTWDGYGCWDDTSPSSTVYITCPSFLEHSISSRYAEKRCRADGTWFSFGNSSREQVNEWTDYTKCLDKSSLLVSIYLGLACNIASVSLLVPAIGIFLVYRPLRKQHRIRLHINFFLALLVSNLISLLWDVLVTHGMLRSTDSATFTSGDGCRVLAFFRLYSRSATYVWMFCEGFYLHRLISNAFRPPKSLLFLYLIGWGLPLGYTTLYAVLRAINANERCWIRSSGHFQWILYAPNLACLVMNLLFLCNILRILVTQLQSHPNEPSNFRRALKATFILIPLFGVQLFVTVYRHPAGRPGAAEYERFSVVVSNAQGFFVAMIFCFFNGEVISCLKRTCTRVQERHQVTEVSRAGQTTATSLHFLPPCPDNHDNHNGNLVTSSPAAAALTYNTMQPRDKHYQYIPMTVASQSTGQTANI